MKKAGFVRLFAVLGLLVLVLAACGKPQSVGTEVSLDFEEQKEKNRLGDKSPEPSPTGSPTTGALGVPSPTPAAPSPTAAEEKFFDVRLVADSPYYEPGNELVMPVGFVLRVTNADNTAERPQRSFRAADGSFDSGALNPGQTRVMGKLPPGRWKIEDMAAPFIFASLEVA